ncbi:MAG TPA: threonine ammonia-lyase, biosynthetic, partial [Burkholderiales bacterium]|nr:threonine ammonia-lyase, biosynthetic [Burkholderiales bacterium]
YVDEVVLVDTDEICAAIKDVFEDTRSILEPAGALAVAGAKIYAQQTGVRDQKLVAVASGANTNFNRLRFVAERAEVGEHREALLAVTIPERPGSFKQLCAALGERSVTEFNYRYADDHAAQVFIGVQVRDRQETAKLIAQLKRQGYQPVDLSDNEMAKLHVRYLVGGHAPRGANGNGVNELLYRFEFPERPGALMRFLSHMRADWNISLFHYRNHGADYGRVLVGMQVPGKEKRAFNEFLATLGYPYEDESDNPAYSLFLA